MNYNLLLVAMLTTSSLVLANDIVTSQKVNILDTKVDTLNEKINSIETNLDTRFDSLESKLDVKLNSIDINHKHVMESIQFEQEQILEKNKKIIISVVGQGVAPMNTISPAQAYALAKRAAVGDAYRLIAEKVKGVRIDGQDLIKNMMVKRSTVRTSVNAMVRNANIVETTFKEGLCEVEMEIAISHSQFAR